MITKSIFRVLGTRSTAVYFLLVWAATLISSVWWLTPGNDDGYYLHQIYSFVEFGTVGLFHFETFYKTFIGFPGYPTLQGIFFIGWEFAGLPINIYTYKAFQIFAMIVAVGLASRLVFELTQDQFRGSTDPTRMATSAWARVSVMLIIFGISPLLVDTLFLRPEPAGLALIVVALLAVRRTQLDGRSQGLWASVAGFCIGASATMHPTFVIAGGVLGLFVIGQLLWRKRILAAALGSGFALVPIGAMGWWFLANGDYAVQALMMHVSNRSQEYGGAVRILLSLIEKPLTDPSLGNLFFAAPLLVLTILMIVVLTLMTWRLVQPFIPTKWRHTPVAIGPISAADVFFLGAFLNFLLDSNGRIQILTVLGFAAALALATSLRPIPDTPKTIGKNSA